MATFASSSLSKGVADGDPDEVDQKKKYEPKKLYTSEVASIFNLKSEYLKKKNDIVRNTTAELYRSGKSSVLAVKKEETVSLKKEASERKRRINEHEAALRKEEEERMALVSKKLKEKSDLYDKLAEGGITLETSDGLEVGFLVDFNAKVKERQEKQMASAPVPDAEPSTSATVEKPTPLVEHYEPDEGRLQKVFQIPAVIDMFLERRVYGPSHMKFSSDEEKRQAQIKSLYDMSAQTDKVRAKNKAEADEKARLKREKLNALRRRKGLPEVRTPSPEPEPEVPAVDLEEIPLPVDESTNKQEKKPVREWDRGKGRYNTWIQKQREEREEEFAPPSFYFNH
ncbi:unnamed protein product [Nippostrongylus brasiliensis]|uniref:DUF2040 domain-containing protein n=1 Tax=Nippostrongylus brasiliensis TaxID=27835 RepID=A0A0N4Y5L1_NIPBR|nr:unnamed protein product [Nippostrongylus brasiliensis]